MGEMVKIDYEKLETILSKAGKTKADLSRDMAKGRNFVGTMKEKPEQPEEIERLMCLLLGIEPGSLIQEEKGTEAKILTNIYREIMEVREMVEGIAEKTEKIWNKAHANTIQIESIKENTKECLKALVMTDYDKAVRFLKDKLSGGRMDGAELLRMADASGIKRADLNKAKKDLGVDTSTTGYGKNQKTWWFLSY